MYVFLYKYSCESENKSVLNWTFYLLLSEKPNCMKLANLKERIRARLICPPGLAIIRKGLSRIENVLLKFFMMGSLSFITLCKISYIFNVILQRKCKVIKMFSDRLNKIFFLCFDLTIKFLIELAPRENPKYQN
jgi:hypothetical protein